LIREARFKSGLDSGFADEIYINCIAKQIKFAKKDPSATPQDDVTLSVAKNLGSTKFRKPNLFDDVICRCPTAISLSFKNRNA
jgi:hypothetical protein